MVANAQAEVLSDSNVGQFRFIAENTSDIITLHRLDGSRVYVSPSFKRILGETLPQEIRGGIHHEDLKTVQEAWDKVSEGEPATVAFRHRDASGDWRWLEATASRICYQGEHYILSVMRDVSDRYRFEEQVRHFQKMEALGRLAGAVAHDFNHVLTAIANYAAIVEKRLPDDPQLVEGAQGMHVAVERARLLVRQLFAFSRRGEHEPRLVDVATVVDGLEAMLRLLVGDDILFTTAIRVRHATTVMDPLKLEQVLVNLVANAVDATVAGDRIMLSVDVEDGREIAGLPASAEPGRHVHIEIADSGIGMVDDVAARAFEPFFTTKPPGSGTGLGLATVRDVVRQSGGHVWIESVPDSGTTVHVALPCRADEDGFE